MTISRLAILPGEPPLVPEHPAFWTERNWTSLERQFTERGFDVVGFSSTRRAAEARGIGLGPISTSAGISSLFDDLGVDAVIVPSYRASQTYSPFLIAGRIRHSAQLKLEVFIEGQTGPLARIDVAGQHTQWIGSLVMAGGVTALAGAEDAGIPIAAVGGFMDLVTSFLLDTSGLGKAFDGAIRAGVEALEEGFPGSPSPGPRWEELPSPGLISPQAGLEDEEIRIRVRISEEYLTESPLCLGATFWDHSGDPLEGTGTYSLEGQVAVVEGLNVSRSARGGQGFELALPVGALGLTGTRNIGRHDLSAKVLLWRGGCRTDQGAGLPALEYPSAAFCVRKLAVGYVPCD